MPATQCVTCQPADPPPARASSNSGESREAHRSAGFRQALTSASEQERPEEPGDSAGKNNGDPSPYIAALGFSHDGVIHGKAMLRSYVERALDRAPQLTFTPEALLVGARGHTLIYRNHRGERAAETHEMDGAGLVVRADATYDTA